MLIKDIHAATVETRDGIATLKGLEAIFENIVDAVLVIAGIILFLMFVYGGFKYLTSGGNQESLASARRTITFALLGLVLIASSLLILVAIEEFTGAKLTRFRIYIP